MGCDIDNREDDDEDIEETIQKRPGRRKKKRKGGKVAKKETEIIEEVIPSVTDYDLTGKDTTVSQNLLLPHKFSRFYRFYSKFYYQRIYEELSV